jgi:hypothetical protein
MAFFMSASDGALLWFFSTLTKLMIHLFRDGGIGANAGRQVDDPVPHRRPYSIGQFGGAEVTTAALR